MARNTSRSSSSSSARSSRPQMSQTRQSSTTAAAAPPTQHAAPPQPIYVPQQQGIMSQIATTAAGVAVGHTVGRMITGMFGGSGGSAVAAEQPQTAAPIQAYNPPQSASSSVAPQCQEYSNLFLRCMSDNGNQFSMCADYMEMMKSCQQQHQQQHFA